MYIRRNRSRWMNEKPPAEEEKLVGFRMSKAKHEVLKELARTRHAPIANLINEALEAHFKLAKKAEKPAPKILGTKKKLS